MNTVRWCLNRFEQLYRFVPAETPSIEHAIRNDRYTVDPEEMTVVWGGSSKKPLEVDHVAVHGRSWNKKTGELGGWINITVRDFETLPADYRAMILAGAPSVPDETSTVSEGQQQ